MRDLLTGLLGVWWLATAAVAGAQPADRLEQANASYDEGRLDAALEQYEAALELGIEDPPQLALVYARLGILHGSFGRADEAGEAFRYALAIDPDMAAPSELGPQQREAFEAARPDAGLAVGLSVQGEPAPQGTTPVVPAVSGAPDGLVAGVRLTASVGGERTWSAQRDGIPKSVDVPSTAWADGRATKLRLEALGRHGGVLGRATRELRAPAPAAPSPGAAAASTASTRDATGGGSAALSAEPREQDDDGSVRTSPWLWTGVGVVVVGAILTGVLVATAEDRYVVGQPMVE